VPEVTRIAEADLRAAATAISTSQRLFVLVGESATPETLSALRNLAALKGRADYLTVLHPGPNAVGVRRAGLTPGEGGKDGARMLGAAAAGDLKVLYVAGHNPLPNAVDADVARRALQATGFVVVQTLFLNELTDYADVVLPAASFLEQDGTTTNFHGKVQNLKRAFRPRERRDADGNTLSACAPDWVIFTKLGQLFGAGWEYTKVQDWTTQWKALPAAPAAQQPLFANGKGEVAPVTSPSGQFQLLTGNLLYDGGESFHYCDRLKRVVPLPYAQINRADARQLGIETGALVELKSARGAVRVVARVGRQVKPGSIWLPRRLRDVAINQLLEAGKPQTFVSIAKLADAPPQRRPDMDEHAVGVGQGAPMDTTLTTAVVP
jgi:predicted molibdopterin-dependent oxidoreductase YjgC